MGAALLVDLGAFHRLEHGDSIVPVLVSLQRWTPFYWDQERYGMLVPLLALPFRDPLVNLLVQRGLMVFASLAAVLLLARHLFADRAWPLIGAVAAAALLLLAPPGWQFEYLGSQPYGLSLALALAGLALAEPGLDGARRPRRRLAAGLVLVLMAHWVNPATGVLLGLLATARAAEDLLDGEPQGAVFDRFRVDGALLAAGLVAGQLSIALYPLVTGQPLLLSVGFLPLAAWPGAWGELLRRAWSESHAWGSVLLGAGALGLLLLAHPSARAVRRDTLLRAGTLLLAAGAYAAFVGALRWVAENQFHPRYVAPAAVLVHLAVVALLAEPLALGQRWSPTAWIAVRWAIPLAALISWGAPSLAGVRADLDRVAGRLTADVRSAGCQLIAGDYWSVWPAVWHARLVTHERGDGVAPWGVAHRAGPTVLQWKGLPAGSLRICRPHGEEAERDAERWLKAFHAWPVRLLERRETVDVLALQPPLE